MPKESKIVPFPLRPTVTVGAPIPVVVMVGPERYELTIPIAEERKVSLSGERASVVPIRSGANPSKGRIKKSRKTQ